MDTEQRKHLTETVARLYQTGSGDAGARWRQAGQLGLLGVTAGGAGAPDPGTERGLDAAGVICEGRGHCGEFGGYAETVGAVFGLTAAGDAAATLLSAVADQGWQLVPLYRSRSADQSHERPYCAASGTPAGTVVDKRAPATVALWHDCATGAIHWADAAAVTTATPVATTSRLPESQLRLRDAAEQSATTWADPRGCQVWTNIGLAVDTLRCAEIVGAARWLQQDALAYANRRVQFGRPIAEFQAVAHQLAMQLSWVEASELLVRRALAAIETGAGGREAARAGAFVRDRAWHCLFASYHILGGTGFIEETPVNRYCRGILGVLSLLGPVQEIELRSAAYVEPGTWLSGAAA